MKEPLIPDFNWQKHVVAPWGEDEISITLWIVLLAILVITTCGLIGNYLILRRMALVGDAISHSVLAGIAVVVVAPVMLKLNSVHVSRSARGRDFFFHGALRAPRVRNSDLGKE